MTRRRAVRALLVLAIFLATLLVLAVLVGGIAYATLGAGIGVVEIVILALVAGYITRVVVRRTGFS